MPRTPQKKRSGQLVASPEKGISAASKKPSSERTKKKKKYQFAPIDSLEDNTRSESNVLRSISVSQLRNSAGHLAQPAKLASKPQQSTLVSRRVPNHTLSSKRKQSQKDSGYDFKKSEEEPSEEVIWEYLPVEKEVSDQMDSSHANSEGVLESEAYHDPSSTPLVPTRLKRIINFTHINEKEQADKISTLSAQQRKNFRLTDQKTILKESLRDIDDILDDIEGDLGDKPGSLNIHQLPSSPSRINPDCGSNSCGDTSSSGDDNSLIDIVTQKYSQRRTDYKRPVEDSDVLDDSLLDHFNSSEDKNNVEQAIGDMEARISQNLNMATKMEGKCIQEKTVNIEREENIRLANSANTRKGVERFVVLKVNEFKLPKVGRQKVLSCINREGLTTSVVVRHPWVFLEFEKGDIIHIIEGKNNENKRLLSDDKNPITQLANDNLLILNPDILLSATSVGSSIECLRRAILQLTLEDPCGEPSIPMIVGNIVHELLQDSLLYKLTHEELDLDHVAEKLDTLMEAYSFQIIQCNENIASIKEDIKNVHLKNILSFVNKFVQKNNYGCYVSVSGTRITQPMSISNVIDIEENIWSPSYGLKGFLDATVEAHVENNYSLVPLEIKTGKQRSLSHETQGLLYTLLLNDRYEVPPEFFLLLYTTSNDLIKYPKLLHSVKHVLMFRNQMATFLKHQLKEITTKDRISKKLPPLMQNSICDKCSVRHMCMVLNKLLEEGTANESGLKDGEYEQLTNHLEINYKENKEFLEKYNDLLAKEESSISGISQELFLLDSKTRESLSGHCISNLVVKESTRHAAHKHLFLHVFVRKPTDQTQQSMLHSQFSLNDMVIISDESGHFSLCQGRITALSSDSITVCTRRKVLNNRNMFNSNDISGIHSVLDEASDKDSSAKSQDTVSYRIDRNDVHNSLKLARFNLLNLFLPPVLPDTSMIGEEFENANIKHSQGGDERMRSILVNNRPPKFSEKPVIPFEIPVSSGFNNDQIQAIEKVMRAEDYALILGMPGTGKTTLIAEIIRILVGAGKSVLLASYTNSAVDNILLKLIPTDINIVRLGVRHRIHPKVLPFLPDYDSISTYDQFLEQINNVSVVATTCLGIKDYIFTVKKKDFDYVILDEASQISMPIALGPIRFGEKFIMVGDHFQLPPLVKNDAARTGGLEESLFKILCDRQQQDICELTFQYRMCEEIVSLSNFLIYDDKLKCGSREVAEKALLIPNPKKLATYRSSSATDLWLDHVLNPQNKVIFLNYDRESTISEVCESDNITNKGEIEIVLQCLDALTLSGIDPSHIGIMTLYRAQLNLLNKSICASKYNGLEILTADQFQGRDKDCIIISMVRCNHQKNAGSLLKELRRVNVAMTRAKSKLIIIGSKETIASTPKMSSFLSFLRAKNSIYDLSQGFLQVYHFTHNPQLLSTHPTTSSSPTKTSSSHNISAKQPPTTKPGARNITPTSKLLRDKPITRQTLYENQ